MREREKEREGEREKERERERENHKITDQPPLTHAFTQQSIHRPTNLPAASKSADQPPTNQPRIHQATNPPIHSPTNPFTYRLPTRVPIYNPINLSISIPIHPSTYPPTSPPGHNAITTRNASHGQPHPHRRHSERQSVQYTSAQCSCAAGAAAAWTPPPLLLLQTHPAAVQHHSSIQGLVIHPGASDPVVARQDQNPISHIPFQSVHLSLPTYTIHLPTHNPPIRNPYGINRPVRAPVLDISPKNSHRRHHRHCTSDKGRVRIHDPPLLPIGGE